MAGGASHAPRRKSLPGEAMAMRIRSPWMSTARTMHDMSRGKTSGLPESSVTWPQLSRLMPVSVPSEKLLCLPEPFTSLNGFSSLSAARPWRAATSSRICITQRFWSICVVARPNMGATSYWLGATSRWRVRSGMPIMKHSCCSSCRQAIAIGLIAAM